MTPCDSRIQCVSICICTWNRAALLDQTLNSLERLAIPDGTEWEVLVVNNNCSDDTDAVLDRHMSTLPLRRLFEPKQGTSAARNCALRSARGQLLVWTDDDVIVERGWLQAYMSAAQRFPMATFFTGPIRPHFEATPPPWIDPNRKALCGPLVMCDYGDVERQLVGDEMPFTANLACRTEVSQRFMFDEAIGHRTDCVMGGEDVDVIERLTKAGYHGVWVPAAGVEHYTPMKRMTRAYLKQWAEGAGAMQARKAWGQPCPSMFGFPRWAIRQWLRATGGWLLAWSSRRREWVSAYIDMHRRRAFLREWRLLNLDKAKLDSIPRRYLQQLAQDNRGGI